MFPALGINVPCKLDRTPVLPPRYASRVRQVTLPILLLLGVCCNVEGMLPSMGLTSNLMLSAQALLVRLLGRPTCRAAVRMGSTCGRVGEKPGRRRRARLRRLPRASAPTPRLPLLRPRS